LVDFSKKWKDLVDKNTPVPTHNEDKDKYKIGVFEGGGYHNHGVYRPSYRCEMRAIGAGFCPVCSQEIERVLNSYAR
jgi:hypothetical protein